MKQEFTEEDVEYNRLNKEQMMRIEKIYSDGAIVTSILLIYLVTCIGLLLEAYKYLLKDGVKNSDILIFPISALSIVFFIFPILLCYTFALKSKEMMDSIISLSNFIKQYYEKPILINGKISGKKWESMHKNTMIPTIRNERKEYYFLALISLILICVCGVVEIMVILHCGSLLSVSFWFVLLTKIGFAAFALIMARKIRQCTNFYAVVSEILSTSLFYKNQKARIESQKQTELVIDDISEQYLGFNLFLLKNHISHDKALELEKLLYNEKYNGNDRVVKKIDKKSLNTSKKTLSQKERIKTYLKAELLKIRKNYF